jgi:apolipoprotein N-acyltransferase
MKDDAGIAAASPHVSFSHQPLSYVLSFALGALCVAGFAPLAWFPLPILALAGLMLLWRNAESPKAAALHGFCFGFGLFIFGVSWVYVSLAEFGGMPVPVAALATLLFCLILALYPAAVGYAQQRLGGSFTMRVLLTIPALWTIAEWLRDTVTGFPWLAFGYAQTPPSPLAGFAPVTGVFGVSLACSLASGLLALLSVQIAGRAMAKMAGAAALALLALFAAGFAMRGIAWTAPSGPPIKVALLQGNIAQSLKFDDDWYEATLATYKRLALASDARLIVWPETAIPRLYDQVDEEFLENLRKRAAANRADMLIGIPNRDAERNFYNSVWSFGASRTQSYSKTHLVPFGEFIPSGFHIVLNEPRPLAVAGEQVAVNICYEDAFGEEIIRQLPQATLLVNVSNVAWFGHSIAPTQHLQISQMRAIETGRPMLRATNTGMTAAVNAHGVVEQQLPQYTEGALVTMVQPHSGATPFVRWGNGLALAVALVMLGIGVALVRRNRV